MKNDVISRIICYKLQNILNHKYNHYIMYSYVLNPKISCYETKVNWVKIIVL